MNTARNRGGVKFLNFTTNSPKKGNILNGEKIMDSNNTFRMTYSAKKQEEIERIRSKYVDSSDDKLKSLKELDEIPERRARTVALVSGIIGILIFGLGMSIALSELGMAFGSYDVFAGAAVGIMGLFLMIVAYPLYHKRLKAERKKIAPEILKLADELLKK